MIRSLRDRETERVRRGEVSRRLPRGIQGTARRKLRLLHVARALDDLRVPPGSRLEALRHDRLRGVRIVRPGCDVRLDPCNGPRYSLRVIRSFRHKGLRELFLTGRGAGVRPDLRKRCLVRLDAPDGATDLRQIDLPGYRLHPLPAR